MESHPRSRIPFFKLTPTFARLSSFAGLGVAVYLLIRMGREGQRLVAIQKLLHWIRGFETSGGEKKMTLTPPGLTASRNVGAGTSEDQASGIAY